MWRANKLHDGIDETPSPWFNSISLICEQLTCSSIIVVLIEKRWCLMRIKMALMNMPAMLMISYLSLQMMALAGRQMFNSLTRESYREIFENAHLTASQWKDGVDSSCNDVFATVSEGSCDIRWNQAKQEIKVANKARIKSLFGTDCPKMFNFYNLLLVQGADWGTYCRRSWIWAPKNFPRILECYFLLQLTMYQKLNYLTDIHKLIMRGWQEMKSARILWEMLLAQGVLNLCVSKLKLHWMTLAKNY